MSRGLWMRASGNGAWEPVTARAGCALVAGSFPLEQLGEEVCLALGYARAARDKHMNLHQAMRAALLGWIRKAG